MADFSPNRLVIANWKMNLTVGQTVKLTRAVIKGVDKFKKTADFELVICPTFPALFSCAAAVKGRKNIKLGAQDAFWKSSGPYTGEVSAEVLAELGVKYVIVGHSERRLYLKETDEMIRYKVLNLLGANLIPILCVGETYSERQAGQRDAVISGQLRQALIGVNLKSSQILVVAYEPVWAIGTGRVASQSDIIQAGKLIDHILIDMWSSEIVSRQVRVLYGGSVDENNIGSCIVPPLSGVLVGGASLHPTSFVHLLQRLS